jgi:hypothetical protein
MICFEEDLTAGRCVLVGAVGLHVMTVAFGTKSYQGREVKKLFMYVI